MPLYRAADRLRGRLRRRSVTPTMELGSRGEDLTHRYLQQQGMIVVARNYRARSGVAELDLVAWDADQLVFVEVKSRSSAAYGPPDRAIGDVKRQHLFRAAREYARRSHTDWQHVRFDIVAVLLPPAGPPAITHFRDVFSLAH